jgi:hypothetical protein
MRQERTLSNLRSRYEETKKLQAYWEREAQKLIHRHGRTISMPDRIGVLESWLNSAGTYSNMERFILEYIKGEHTTGLNRHTSTSDVHPASRWGFSSFPPFEKAYWENEHV